MKPIELKDNENGRFEVVVLDNGVQFIHDNKTGKNFFNQKAIQQISGLGQSRVSQALNRYEAQIGNITISNISLMLLNSSKKTKFYSFDCVNFVVMRSDQKEALEMRQYISDAIDEKFNRENGFNMGTLIKTNRNLRGENSSLGEAAQYWRIKATRLESENEELKYIVNGYRKKYPHVKEPKNTATVQLTLNDYTEVYLND